MKTVQTKVQDVRCDQEKAAAKAIVKANFKSVHRFGGSLTIDKYLSDLRYTISVNVYKAGPGKVFGKVVHRYGSGLSA